MGKRVRLCPEITDPGLRSFLDILPGIRRFNKDVLAAQTLSGETLTVPLAGREITVCLHRAAGNGMRPVLFEYHGGGFMMGDAEKDDRLCEEIARELDIHVIGVNYRLAPENPYPAAVDDAYDVILYFKEHAEEFGIDPERMAVMGYSGGATLAAVVSMKCAKTGDFGLKAQILHYPYLDSVRLPEEKTHYDSDMDPEVMRAFTLLYAKEEERSLPYVSPVTAKTEDLKGLAPACILPAESDSLKEEGLLYAKMLEEAGVPVYCHVIPEAHHGYIEDAANDELYSYTAEDTKALHSPYFRAWAKAAIGISEAFLKKQFGEA